MIALIISVFNGLAAIPQIAGYIEQLASAITLWWVQRQNNQTLSQISDAAALQARAQTDDDRYKAAQAWQSALSRPKSSP